MSWWDRQVDKSATLGKFFNYTPTFSAETGSWTPTIGIARYSQVGGLCALRVNLTAGAASNNTAYLTMTIPLTSKSGSNQIFPLYLETGTGTFVGIGLGLIPASGTTLRIYLPNSATITAGNALASFNAFYEVERGY